MNKDPREARRGTPAFSGGDYRCIDNARKSVRAGNTAEVVKWLRVADKLLSVDERRHRLRYQASAPKGPVMLDPKGFSPGGTPNWALNQQRLQPARVGTRNPVK